MVGLGPHQASPHQAESANSQQQDDFLNLEQERDIERYWEGNVHTSHTSKSHSQVGSHVSQRQNSNKAMQLEIDDLKKKLRHAQRKQTPSSPDTSFNDEEDDSYRRRSRIPPSVTFSYDEERLINAETRARLVKASETTPWPRRWIKSQNHLLSAR